MLSTLKAFRIAGVALVVTMGVYLAAAQSPKASPPLAQVDSKDGPLRVQVVDPDGGAVPNAHVSIINEARDVVSVGQSDANGLFQCPALAEGLYHIRIKAVGFLNTERMGVKIPSVQSVKIQIRVGESPSTVDPKGDIETPVDSPFTSEILKMDLPLIATVQAPPKRNFLARLFSGIKNKLQ